MKGRTLALALAVVVTAATAFAWSSASGGQSAVTFSTIPAAKLAIAGLTLSSPTGRMDCWAVSLDPTGMSSDGPPESPSQRFTYDLVLVDPKNDRPVRGYSGA